MEIENEFEVENTAKLDNTQVEKTPQEEKSTRLSPTDPERLRQTIEKLKRGYTRIPNTILMDLISGKLSKTEIKAALLIARFTAALSQG